MDLALALVEEDYGRDLALIVARYMVMFLKRPGGQSEFSAHLAAQISDMSPLQAVLDHVLKNLPADLSVDALAAKAGMSTRNFARVFHREVGATPADFVEAARLDAARRMLQDTPCHCSASPSYAGSAISTGCGGCSAGTSGSDRWTTAGHSKPATWPSRLQGPRWCRARSAWPHMAEYGAPQRI